MWLHICAAHSFFDFVIIRFVNVPPSVHCWAVRLLLASCYCKEWWWNLFNLSPAAHIHEFLWGTYVGVELLGILYKKKKKAKLFSKAIVPMYNPASRVWSSSNLCLFQQLTPPVLFIFANRVAEKLSHVALIAFPWLVRQLNFMYCSVLCFFLFWEVIFSHILLLRLFLIDS